MIQGNDNATKRTRVSSLVKSLTSVRRLFSRVQSTPELTRSNPSFQLTTQVDIVIENGSISDLGDICMKTIISSFKMDEEKHEILFFLNDTNDIKLNVISEDPIIKELIHSQKDYTLSLCAMGSILRLLYKKDCIKRTVYSFAAEDGDVVRGPDCLFTDPKITNGCIDCNDTVSLTYGYLNERKLAVVLNKNFITPEIYQLIRETLKSTFNEYQGDNEDNYLTTPSAYLPQCTLKSSSDSIRAEEDECDSFEIKVRAAKPN